MKFLVALFLKDILNLILTWIIFSFFTLLLLIYLEKNIFKPSMILIQDTPN